MTFPLSSNPGSLQNPARKEKKEKDGRTKQDILNSRLYQECCDVKMRYTPSSWSVPLDYSEITKGKKIGGPISNRFLFIQF